MTRILVVEDEAIVAMELGRTLARMGHEVVGPVATGEEAIRRALEGSPDLILMDIRLRGEMDGIEALERIRAERDIPAIYLTAYGDAETLRRAKARPLGYLVKPYEERELGAAIEAVLHNDRLEKDRARVKQAFRRSEAGD